MLWVRRWRRYRAVQRNGGGGLEKHWKGGVIGAIGAERIVADVAEPPK